AAASISDGPMGRFAGAIVMALLYRAGSGPDKSGVLPQISPSRAGIACRAPMRVATACILAHLYPRAALASGGTRRDLWNNGRPQHRIGPGDDLEPAVLMLHERGAAFHPVAAVHVADALLVADGGVMDVAADHALGAVTPRLGCERRLERADIVDRVLDLLLGPLRQRPVAHTEHAAEEVHQTVHLDRKIVGLVTEMSEPARVLHDEIEDVAVNDEVAAAVGTGMHGVFHDIDAAEMRAVIVAQELVVIAGDVDDLGTLARLAQHLLHEVVVRLRPVPVRLQRPAVDDIADQIDRVGIVAAKEIQQSVGLRAAGSEMNIGDEESAKAPFRIFITRRV